VLSPPRAARLIACLLEERGVVRAHLATKWASAVRRSVL